MFANAPVLAPTKKPKADKVQVQMEGLSVLGYLSFSLKAMEAAYTLHEGPFKDGMAEKFATDGMRAGKRPDNFTGVDGDVTASCEFRSKGREVVGDELAYAKDHKIDTVEVVDIHDTYNIHPDFAHDAKVQAVLQKALEPLIKSGKLPANLIVRQNGVTRTFLGPNAMDQIFQKNDLDVVKRLMSIAGVLAIKPKVNNSDAPSIFAHVVKMMKSFNKKA